MGQIRRRGYEVVIVVIVVVATVVLGGALFAGRAKVSKTNLLANELSMMRSSITLYKLVNKKNPQSIEELSTATYKVDSTQRPFLDRMPKDEGGKATDPFGNPYRYDPKSGWVSSITPDFERW